MRRPIRIAILLFVVGHVVNSQPVPQDPLQWKAPIRVESKNVFLLWTEGGSSSTMKSYQKVYRYLLAEPSFPPQQRLIDTARHEDSRLVQGNQQMYAVAGNLNGDAFDDVIAVWEGANRTIELLIPHFDTLSMDWSTSTTLTIPGPVTPYSGGARGRIFARMADLDGDSLDEIVLGYHGADSTIHLDVYDSHGSLDPQLVASIHDEILLPAPTSSARFALETADLDGDGVAEVILAGFSPSGGGPGVWGIYLKVYTLAGNALTPRARDIVLSQPFSASGGLNFGIAAGQFKPDAKEELAFGCTINRGDTFGDDTFVQLLEAGAALDTLIVDASKRDGDDRFSNELPAYSLASGDLNGDGRDEVVYALGSSFFVYATDSLLNLQYKVSGPAISHGPDDDRTTFDFMDVVDVDQDGRVEVAIAKNVYGNGTTQEFTVSLYSVSNPLTAVSLKATRSNDEVVPDIGGGTRRLYAIAIGNFDGTSFTIGAPTVYSKTNVIQPLVVLNAPPVHFDMFAGTTYDVNRCYSGSVCDFTATYTRSLSTVFEVKTTVKNDVGFSAGVGGSGSVGVSAGVSADTNYEWYIVGKVGLHWSNDSTSRKSVSVGSSTMAAEDDQIYATITDYDFWEYPIYAGSNTTPWKSVLFMRPARSEGRWFPSKGSSASRYWPDHEVGNVLSYPAFDSVRVNPNVGQSIKGNYSSDGYTLASSGGFDWTLAFSDFSSSGSSFSWDAGVDFKYSFTAIFGFNYSHTRMTSHTTEVTDNLDLKIHLGTIDLSIGETRYAVTPYAYWSTDGALVVDYVVKPEIAAPGIPPTWWQQHYGTLSDPTMILPWRYDPEKGFGISEEAKRHQTSDIRFDRSVLSAGDTLTIQTRVRNFSLIPTPGPVGVRYYIGDPDSGGTPIVGLHGETTVWTGSFVPERSWRDVEMRWIIPSGLAPYQRVYAVLDPTDSIPEIHSTNNKGFAVLGSEGGATGVDWNGGATSPERFVLHQAYPNPFNPVTSIRYSVPQKGTVVIRVYDALGRSVETLASGELLPGSYTAQWDAGGLPSGIYIIRLEGGGTQLAQKIVLLK